MVALSPEFRLRRPYKLTVQVSRVRFGRLVGFNWGLIGGLGFCLAFWLLIGVAGLTFL
jgi:hypothetical protein